MRVRTRVTKGGGWFHADGCMVCVNMLEKDTGNGNGNAWHSGTECP